MWLAIAASVAIVLASPFVGELRGAIQSAFPGHYRAIVASIVGAAVLVAVAAAVMRIRDRRPLRYGLIGLSLAIGLGYAGLTSSGNPEVDAVERFHFVEYGLLALLYQRACRGRNDRASVALPLIAGMLVGIVDEWLQWFIPFRVGEVRDLLLNGVALGCGLLFGLGLAPPEALAPMRTAASRRSLAASTMVTIACGAAFFHAVHLGHEVSRSANARFRSRFTAEELAQASRDRAVRWNGMPPVEPRLSREDHYLSEGRWHVQERNEAVGAGDWRTAWQEELILGAFYGPVLDVLPAVRWMPEQRADVETRAGAEGGAYRSRAHPHPIATWPPSRFWVVIGATIAAVAWIGLRGPSPAQRRMGQTV